MANLSSQRMGKGIQAKVKPKSQGVTVIPDIAESFVSPMWMDLHSDSRACSQGTQHQKFRGGYWKRPGLFKNPKKPSTPHESASPFIADLLKRSR